MACRPMPRRYLTVMNLMWGLGALPLVAIGLATAVWQIVVAGFVLGAMFSAPMEIAHPLRDDDAPAVAEESEPVGV